MTSFFNNLLDRAIRVYFLHLMKLSDCVSHVMLSVTTWSILLQHMTLENRGIETKKFQRCYELQRKCTLTAIFFFYFLHIVQLLRTFVHLLQSSLSGS